MFVQSWLELRELLLTRAKIALVGWVLVALSGCTGVVSPPYLWPPLSLLAVREDEFTIRYSSWWNSPEQVQTLIREQCGTQQIIARGLLFENRGTLLHPHELQVRCSCSDCEQDDGFWLWLNS